VLVNDLVPPDDIVNAVSLNSTLVTLARIVGPAVAGLMHDTVGTGWCFALNAVSFVPVLYGLVAMDWDAMPTRVPAEREKGQVRAGLRYAWSVDDLRVPLLVMAVVGTLAFNYTTVMPVFADRVLHGGGGTFTALMTVMGVGSLVASLVMARRETIDTAYVVWSTVLLAGSTVALALTGNLVLSAAAIAVVGYAGIGVLSGGNAVLQVYAAPEMRARVLALFTVVFLGSTPIGGPVVGYLTEHFGAPMGLLVGAVAAGLSAAYALAFLRRRAGAAPETVVPATATAA
jgi:predicted MFS family arabinose efflux permease